MRRGEPGYWGWRAKAGKPKNLKSPKQLWQLACEYFQTVDDSPFITNDFIKGGDMAGTIVGVPKMDVFLWQDFEDFLDERGVLAKLDDYRSNKDNRYADYADVLTRITNIIYSRKFKGAAVGAFHAGIIAKDLGITEKIQQQMTIIEQPLFPDSD